MKTYPLAATFLLAAVPATLAAERSFRVLVVSAASASDPALLRQRALFAAMGRQAQARDLVMREAVGDLPGAQALRHDAGLDGAGFAVALVGKDGGVKLRAREPLGAERLLATIDAMPMRQRERRERDE